MGCSSECDTSTADGAADCICDLNDKTVSVSEDEKKLEELANEMVEVSNQIEEAIEAGNYTKKELQEILESRGCGF